MLTDSQCACWTPLLPGREGTSGGHQNAHQCRFAHGSALEPGSALSECGPSVGLSNGRRPLTCLHKPAGGSEEKKEKKKRWCDPNGRTLTTWNSSNTLKVGNESCESSFLLVQGGYLSVLLSTKRPKIIVNTNSLSFLSTNPLQFLKFLLAAVAAGGRGYKRVLRGVRICAFYYY